MKLAQSENTGKLGKKTIDHKAAVPPVGRSHLQHPGSSAKSEEFEHELWPSVMRETIENLLFEGAMRINETQTWIDAQEFKQERAIPDASRLSSFATSATALRNALRRLVRIASLRESTTGAAQDRF